MRIFRIKCLTWRRAHYCWNIPRYCLMLTYRHVPTHYLILECLCIYIFRLIALLLRAERSLSHSYANEFLFICLLYGGNY